MHVACSNRIERFTTSSSTKMERSVTTSYRSEYCEDAPVYIRTTCSLERLRHGSSHWPLSDSASILISSSETVNLAFSSPASYVTVLVHGRSVELERVRNSKCRMFNELERNKIIIYAVRIFRMFE